MAQTENIERFLRTSDQVDELEKKQAMHEVQCEERRLLLSWKASAHVKDIMANAKKGAILAVKKINKKGQTFSAELSHV